VERMGWLSEREKQAGKKMDDRVPKFSTIRRRKG
jgi:hypothetical protein